MSNFSIVNSKNSNFLMNFEFLVYKDVINLQNNRQNQKEKDPQVTYGVKDL